MSVRISIFAVDLTKFEPWLARNVADAFFYIARELTEETTLPSVYDDVAGNRYLVTPRRQVVIGSPHRPLAVNEHEAREIPILAQTIADYLRKGSVYDLLFLLRGFSVCPDAKIAFELTSGFKPWWIGSVLEAARTSSQLSPSQFAELEGYLTRILGGFNCGFSPTRSDRAPRSDRFPVWPEDDPDMRFAAFDRTEYERLFSLFDVLRNAIRSFYSPPLLESSDDETNWDDWVRRMIAAIGVIRELRLEDGRMLSFVG